MSGDLPRKACFSDDLFREAVLAVEMAELDATPEDVVRAVLFVAHKDLERVAVELGDALRQREEARVEIRQWKSQVEALQARVAQLEEGC